MLPGDIETTRWDSGSVESIPVIVDILRDICQRMSNVVVVCGARYFPGPEAHILPRLHRLPSMIITTSAYMPLFALARLARDRKWSVLIKLRAEKL